MPCSDEDSKDIAYIRKIFNFIESNPDKFDASRVYAEGFSQNSMFSAYIGFCFPDNVVGIWQGGSGMAITGDPINLPGCQGQVTASDFANECSNCNDFISNDKQGLGYSTGTNMYEAMLEEGHDARLL